jgi:hypothetical protein
MNNALLSAHFLFADHSPTIRRLLRTEDRRDTTGYPDCCFPA